MAKTKIKYIDIDNEIYKCKVYKKNKKCKKGFAYIKGNFVYPFRGELREGKLKAGIYEDSDGNNVLVRAMNKAYKYKMDLVYDPDDDLIKQIIEDLNDMTNLHIPSLITQITNKYCPNSIEYIEFLGFNEYGPGVQHLYRKDITRVGETPEFITVHVSDDLTPAINIHVV